MLKFIMQQQKMADSLTVSIDGNKLRVRGNIVGRYKIKASARDGSNKKAEKTKVPKGVSLKKNCSSSSVS